MFMQIHKHLTNSLHSAAWLLTAFMVLICFLSALSFPAQAAEEAGSGYDIHITLKYAGDSDSVYTEEDYQDSIFVLQDSNSWYLIAEYDQNSASYRVTGRTNNENDATLFRCSKNSDGNGGLVITNLRAGSYLMIMKQTKETFTLLHHDVLVSIPGDVATVDGYSVDLISSDGSSNLQVPFTIQVTRGLDLPRPLPYDPAPFIGVISIASLGLLLALLFHFFVVPKKKNATDMNSQEGKAIL